MPWLRKCQRTGLSIPGPKSAAAHTGIAIRRDTCMYVHCTYIFVHVSEHSVSGSRSFCPNERPVMQTAQCNTIVKSDKSTCVRYYSSGCACVCDYVCTHGRRRRSCRMCRSLRSCSVGRSTKLNTVELVWAWRPMQWSRYLFNGATPL